MAKALLYSGVAGRLIVGFAVMTAALWVSAQSYPVKPVQVISAASLGSTGDVAMRLIAPRMGASLGQQVLVDTRSAAGGSLAALPVMRAPPDGYTLLYATPNILVQGKFVNKNQQFDVLKDFSLIGLTIGFPLFMVANGDLPINTVPELIDYARKNPGKLAYGSTGHSSVPHLLMESFKIVTGTDILHVPYTASSAATTVFSDLLSGRIQLYAASFTPIKPQLGGGKIKVLALMDDFRYKSLPQVPAVVELVPNYRGVPAIFGLLGPNGLARPLIDRLNSEARKALHAPDVSAKLDDLGMYIIGSTPEGMRDKLKREIESAEKLFSALGVKPE